MARAKSPRRKTIILRPITPSAAFEGSDQQAGSLERALIEVVVGLIRWARANVIPVIVVEKRAYHADDAGQNARSIIEAMRLEAERLAATAQMNAQREIGKEAARHTRQFAASVQVQAQIDLTALLRDDDLADFLSVRSEQMNSLITNLAQDIHHRIERETLQAIYDGRSNADIAISLRDVEGIGRNRARLIARDQAAKLNSGMNEFRQSQAGITHYKWKTILDGRERPSHHANNNKVFAWAKPPANTGHPGHDINCRCRGLAIITDEPGDLENSATPIDPEGELGDFFTENLPAIRSVASVPSTQASTLSAGDIAEKLGIAVELQASLAKAGKDFTEKHAEQLVVELYGFLPKDGDLEGFIGGLSSLFATRRTTLKTAAAARLQMIEGVLRQAAIAKTKPKP